MYRYPVNKYLSLEGVLVLLAEGSDPADDEIIHAVYNRMADLLQEMTPEELGFLASRPEPKLEVVS